MKKSGRRPKVQTYRGDPRAVEMRIVSREMDKAKAVGGKVELSREQLPGTLSSNVVLLDGRPFAVIAIDAADRSVKYRPWGRNPDMDHYSPEERAESERIEATIAPLGGPGGRRGNDLGESRGGA